jgi:hypothetical protein
MQDHQWKTNMRRAVIHKAVTNKAVNKAVTRKAVTRKAVIHKAVIPAQAGIHCGARLHFDHGSRPAPG